MHVVLADLRAGPLAQARATVAAFGAATGARVETVVTDVSDPEQVAAAGRAAEQAFGKLHVLVNNAGVAMHGIPVEQATPETWRRVIGVNVMGAIHGIHALLPLIRRHGEGGHVVNTASISGFFVREGRHQGGYAHDQIRRGGAVRGAGAGDQGQRHRRFGAVPRPGAALTFFAFRPPRARPAPRPPMAFRRPHRTRGSWCPRGRTRSATTNSTSSPIPRNARWCTPVTHGSRRRSTAPMRWRAASRADPRSNTMRHLAMVLLLSLTCPVARAAEPPILDTAAVPYVEADGNAAYEDFLLVNLPRAFAVASSGAYGWFGGTATPEQVRATALASCASKGGTDCAIYAEDLTVVWPGRPRIDPPPVPGPLITGTGYAFVPDVRFIWHGPQTARGLYVWGHGNAGGRDESNVQPQNYVRAFNNAGFDVVRFAREGFSDYADSAEGWLRAALPKLRARGWRTLVVGGQSRGAWNSLQMLDTPGLADAVIAISPANLNFTLRGSEAAELHRILYAANAPTTRVAIAQFTGDTFVTTSLDERVASLRDGLTGRVGTLLIIDQPKGLTGHGAGGSYDFAHRFAACLLHFVLDPEPLSTCDQAR